jgi:hypothetical protein
LFQGSHNAALFSLGIGTQWVANKVATSHVPPCDYTGIHANAEYQAISGCTAVPLEQSAGDPGVDCSHWSDACMKNDIMSPYSGGADKLSKITLGTLEDLGYVVDYTKADPFGKADLGTAAGCICNRRSLLDVHRNETRLLGLGHPDTVRRVQSNDALHFANNFGQKIMEDNALPSNIRRDDGPMRYGGDQFVSVAVRNGEEVVSVVVRGQN